MGTMQFTFGSFTQPLSISDNTFEVHAAESGQRIIQRGRFLFGNELPCDFIFTNNYIAGINSDELLLIPAIIPDSRSVMENFVNKLPDDFKKTHKGAIDQMYEWVETKNFDIDVTTQSLPDICDLLLHIAFEFEVVMQFEYHEGGISKLNDLCFFVNGNKLGYNVYNGQQDAIVFAREVYAGTGLRAFLYK